MGAIPCSTRPAGGVEWLTRCLSAHCQNEVLAYRHGDLMRLVALLLCLAVAGCASTGSDDALNAASPAAATAAPVSAGEPPPRVATPSQPAGAPADEKPAAPPMTLAERLTQARVDCWMKVERDRSTARNIDRRIALVDKCVAERTKAAH